MNTRTTLKARILSQIAPHHLIAVPLALALFVGFTAMPQSAHAWSIRGDLTGQNNQFVNTDAGAVSADMATTGTYLRLGVEPNRNLGIDLSWHPFTTSSYTFGGITADAEVDILTAGATWGVPVTRWFRPFGRAAVGLGTSYVSLDQGVRATGRVTSPALAIAGGFELLVPPGVIMRNRDFTVGFLLEFGWMHVFHQDVELEVDRSTSPTTSPTTIQAGALGWSAFTTRFGLVVRI